MSSRAQVSRATALFPDRFPLSTSFDQRCVRVKVNMPPALLAEIPESFVCHCGNTAVEQTPNKSHQRELDLERNIFPPHLQGIEQNFVLFADILGKEGSNGLLTPSHPCRSD